MTNSAPLSTCVPRTREPEWLQRHEGHVAFAKNGGIELLFIGDSITDGWQGAGRETWSRLFAPLKAANFGISGDWIENVLWRSLNGALEVIRPKLIVLLIGTNNTSVNAADVIVPGIENLVKVVRQKQPQAKILLMALFPRGPEHRNKICKDTNKAISKLDDGGKTLTFLDISRVFLTSDGQVSTEMLPDLLHLSSKGYAAWGDAIYATVKEMMGAQ